MPHPLHLHLKTLLVQNTGEVLQQLQKVFAANTRKLNEVILLTQSLAEFGQKQRKGTLPKEEERRQFTEINDHILSLIDTITDAEAAAYELENAIFKRILVVCKSADREEYMRALFPGQYFKGVEYDISEKPRAVASVNRFDLVVFDSFPPGEVTAKDEHKLLCHYLDNTKPYLLYFGTLPLRWLGDDYPEKAYFANSIFSLHARIEEMMTYLKYRHSE